MCISNTSKYDKYLKKDVMYKRALPVSTRGGGGGGGLYFTKRGGGENYVLSQTNWGNLYNPP